jgi:hypothetical protein
MTVKDAVSVLKHAKTIALGWGESAIEFDKDNLLMMEAYGNFVVDSIRSVGDDSEAYYEVNIAVYPVKAGA